jgi:hypothetical protein
MASSASRASSAAGRRFAEEFDMPAEGHLRIRTEPVDMEDLSHYETRHANRSIYTNPT